VKSWNGSNGYGFIVGHGVGGDVMFGRTDLPEDAREVRGKFLDGRKVRYDFQMVDGRAKATNVEILAADGEDMTGIIKSYSNRHGYGFISSSMAVGDVRFNGSDLQSLGAGADPKGELVVFQAQSKPDGKLQATKVMFQSKKIAEKCGGGAPMMQTGQVRQPALDHVNQFLLAHLLGQLNQLGQSGDLGQMSQIASQIAELTKTGAKRPSSVMGGAAPFKKLKPTSGADVGTGQYMSGTVKSYNATKGFGFITGNDLPGDIFFMSKSLPEELQDVSLQGQSVMFELASAPDGKLRAQDITSA